MNLTPSEQMASFATAVATECKATRALVASAKEISDSATGTGTTWSSSKISSELIATKNAVKADLLGGAGTAYDTLKELGILIETNASSIEALEALAAGHVRFNAAQSLTDAQKTQARSNIGAASQSAQDAIDSRLGTAESGLATVTATANSTKDTVETLSATVGTKANDSVVVKLSGNQTIAGTKTFSSTISGSISGNAATATKATQDASGNVITDTYLTKTDAADSYLGKTAKASSATKADSATKATQDASGNVITSTYATKASLAAVATSGKYSDLSGTPTALKNPTELILQNSAGTSIGSYNGSTATTIKLTASTVGLGNVTNESKTTMLASAALTGTPTAPTATAGTNTTQVATTAFVTTAIANKTSVSGNAGTATKLATAKTIALSGDVSGSADFDGSEGITITATVADDSHNHVIGNVDGLQTALNAKAPLASPTLTGTPKAPTATAGTNTTQIATTAFVNTAVANLVNSAPETLDTLGELATALSENVEVTTALNTAIGSKANNSEVVKLSGNQTIAGTKTFSSTISGSISGNAATATKATQDASGNVITSTYAPLASPTFTGTPKAPTAAAGTNTTQVATTAFVTTAVANKTSVASATKATQDGSGNTITSTYATKTELTNGLAGKFGTSGGNISGHVYLIGAKENSSTSNTSQIVFGTADNNHVAISSNQDALVINPDTSSTTNQIVLYLNKASQFPRGITADVTGNLSGTATKATKDGSGNVIVDTYATKASLAAVATSGAYSDLTGTPTALKNPSTLTLQNSAGTSLGAYDGSSAKTIKLTASTVGLGNVTNESKATMFTSPAFTGTPTAPTAASTANNTQITTTAWVRSFVSSALSGIAGASVAQVGDIKLFHGSLGGSDGRRPVDGKTGVADEAWELCDGTNGTPDLRGRLAYGAGGTVALGANVGAAAETMDAETWAYTLKARTGKTTKNVLTSPPQGVGLYYLKKTS